MNSFSRAATHLLLVAAVLLAGCSQGGVGSATIDSTLDSTGKAFTGLYEEYVEPEPKILLEPQEFGETEERKLAYLLMPVDEKVWELIKFMDGEDRLPTEDWFRRLFERYEWISGVLVVDEEGDTLFQHPIDYNRSVDVEALLAIGDPAVEDGEEFVEEVQETEAVVETVETETEEEVEPEAPKRWLDHSLRGYAGNSTLGPEVYLVQPFYEDNDFNGLTIVYFDPRNLLEYCPEPDELMILTSEGVIWSAGYPQASSELASLPWEDVLSSRVYGVATAAGEEFYWLGRNMGDFYLIYATAVPDENLEEVIEAQDEMEDETEKTPEVDQAGAAGPAS